MRFLLDASISPSVGEGLRAAGYDAIHITDLVSGRATDATVLQLAREDHRSVICADTDFGTLLAQENAVSPSVILFRGDTQRRPGRQVILLVANLDDLADAIAAGCIAVFRADHLRVRDLPIGPV